MVPLLNDIMTIYAAIAKYAATISEVRTIDPTDQRMLFILKMLLIIHATILNHSSDLKQIYCTSLSEFYGT